MSLSIHIKRLTGDLEELIKEPVPNCSAGPIDNKMDHWKATIFGPEGTPYHGGVFELELKLLELVIPSVVLEVELITL